MGLQASRFRGGSAVSGFGGAAGQPGRMDAGLRRIIAASVDLSGSGASNRRQGWANPFKCRARAVGEFTPFLHQTASQSFMRQ